LGTKAQTLLSSEWDGAATGSVATVAALDAVGDDADTVPSEAVDGEDADCVGVGTNTGDAVPTSACSMSTATQSLILRPSRLQCALALLCASSDK
jgi:hypothetical protein